MAKAKKRHISLVCQECKAKNYYVNKSQGKLPNPPKLELNKFCSNCRKQTAHKETKDKGSKKKK